MRIMKFPRGKGVMLLLLAAVLLCGCRHISSGMADGIYTAEAAHFDEHGWKEYITISVANNTIITVDYNAKNASGFIKSWDMQYMRVMNSTSGTYPNEYTRIYAEELLVGQSPDAVDCVTGATHSYETFLQLGHAVIEQARAGDKNVVFVEFEAQ